MLHSPEQLAEAIAERPILTEQEREDARRLGVRFAELTKACLAVEQKQTEAWIAFASGVSAALRGQTSR